MNGLAICQADALKTLHKKGKQMEKSKADQTREMIEYIIKIRNKIGKNHNWFEYEISEVNKKIERLEDKMKQITVALYDRRMQTEDLVYEMWDKLDPVSKLENEIEEEEAEIAKWDNMADQNCPYKRFEGEE